MLEAVEEAVRLCLACREDRFGRHATAMHCTRRSTILHSTRYEQSQASTRSALRLTAIPVAYISTIMGFVAPHDAHITRYTTTEWHCHEALHNVCWWNADASTGTETSQPYLALAHEHISSCDMSTVALLPEGHLHVHCGHRHWRTVVGIC